MRRFNVASDFATALASLTAVGTPTSLKTQLGGSASGTTLRRGKIVEVAIGPVTNPVTQDCNVFYSIGRISAAGTGTTVTPVWVGVQEAGSDIPVPGSTWAANHSAEPTYQSGKRLWTKALNQHSGFIWYSPDDMGLPWAAVAGDGLGCGAKGMTADYTGSVIWEVKFEE